MAEPPPAPPGGASAAPALTPTELKALALVAQGWRNRDVMAAVGRSGTWLSATKRKAGLAPATPHARRAAGAARPTAAPPTAPDRADPRAVGEAGGSLDRRLERLLSARIEDLELRAAAGLAEDPEAVARALSLNVRTLATLRRVGAGSRDERDKGGADDGETPARSLSQLRDELRAHLQRLRVEGRARRSRRRLGAHGSGVPGAAGPLADPGEPA